MMVTPKKYIVYDNRDDQWNDGHVQVYLNKELHQSFFVNELKDKYEEFDMDFSIYEFIDELKEIYDIQEDIWLDSNWR
jgi:hypothetical protein